MSVEVRVADVAEERGEILALLQQEFTDWADDSKLDWLYMKNPFGPARAWTLRDDQENLVGISTAFPRRLVVDGRVLKAWVLGDFCVSKAFRSLGPAIMLQRAAIEAVNRGDVDVLYDFPNQTMLAVYRRMGLRNIGEIVRLVRPLKVDQLVEARVPIRSIARAVSAAGNALLSARDSLSSNNPDMRIARWDGDIDGSFEGLAVSGRGVQMDRSPAYLNWRYRADPKGGVSLLAADQRGRHAACFALRDEGVSSAILDGFGDESAFENLVLGSVAHARSTSASSVSVTMSLEHPWISKFEKLGFHRRESSPYVVYARPDALEDGTPWFLMTGDRDL